MKDLATQKILIQTVNDREQYAAISQLNKGCGVSVYTDGGNIIMLANGVMGKFLW